MAQLNKNGVPSEDQEQAWLVAWFRKEYPQHRMFAIPNGGLRTKSQAAILKATGVCAGVPDLMISVAAQGFHGLFIELKAQKGGRVDDDQKEWHSHLQSQGYKVEVCKGFEAAKEAIRCYLE